MCRACVKSVVIGNYDNYLDGLMLAIARHFWKLGQQLSVPGRQYGMNMSRVRR
jgi:hypothetical protein